MKPIDVLEDTKAFVAMVKLQEMGADLFQVAIFFPDAILIDEKDYKDPSFGRGMFLLTQQQPPRVAKIISTHVQNYNVLGFNLIEHNPTPEGKLAGMFILSVAFKEAGRELFDKVPEPDFFSKILEEIESFLEKNQENLSIKKVKEFLKQIKIPEGIKEGFEYLLSPSYYFDKYSETISENHNRFKDLILNFFLYLYLIYSALLLISRKESLNGRILGYSEEKKVLTVEGKKSAL